MPAPELNLQATALQALRQSEYLHGSAALGLLMDQQQTLEVVTTPALELPQQQSKPNAARQQQHHWQWHSSEVEWPQGLQPRPVYLPAQLQQLADVLHACTSVEQLHTVVCTRLHAMHPACVALAMQKVTMLQRQHSNSGDQVSQLQQQGPYPDRPASIQHLKVDVVLQLTCAMVQQLPAASCQAMTAFVTAAAAGQVLLSQQALDLIAIQLVHRGLRTACLQRQQQVQQRNSNGTANSQRRSVSAYNSSQQGLETPMQPNVRCSQQQVWSAAAEGTSKTSPAVTQQQQQLSLQHPLARSAWALAKLQYRHIAVWRELGSLAGENLKQLSPHDCVLLSWALAKGPQHQPRLFNALQHRLKGHMQQLSPNAISCLLWSYATVGHYHHAGIAALVATAAGSMECFGPPAMTRTLWACVKLRHFDARLLGALRVKALASMQDFEPQSLSTLMWGLSSLGVADMQLAEAVAERAATVMGSFIVQGLANLAWGTAKMQQLQQRQQQRQLAHELRGAIQQKRVRGVPQLDEHAQQLQQNLISNICSVAAGQLQAAKPQEVCNLLWACAVVRHRDEQFLAAACTRLTNAAEDASPHDLAQAMWALETLRYRSKATNQVLSGCAHNKLHMFGPQALSNWSWAVASAGMRVPACTRAAVAQQCQVLLPLFTPQGLATTLWAISKMGFIPQQLVHEASHHILANITCFNAQDLCNISMACAKSGYREPELLRGLANAATSAAAASITLTEQEFGTSNTASILHSRPGHSPNTGEAWSASSQSQIDQQLLSSKVSSGLFSVLHQKRLTPQGVCNLVWAFAGMGWHEPELLQQLQQLAAAAVLGGQVKAENIAGLVQGYALLGHSCGLLFDALEECKVLGLEPKRNMKGSAQVQMLQPGPADGLQSHGRSSNISSKAVRQLKQQRWRRQLLSWPSDALALLLWGCVATGAHKQHIAFVSVVLEVLAAAGVSGLSEARRAQLHLTLTLLATEWTVIHWGQNAGLEWAQPCTRGQVSSNNSRSEISDFSVHEPDTAAERPGRCSNPSAGPTPAAVAILQDKLAEGCARAWQHEEAAATLGVTEEEVLQVLQSMGLKPLAQRWIQPAQVVSKAGDTAVGKSPGRRALSVLGWSSFGLRVNVGVTSYAPGNGQQPVAVEVCSGKSLTSSWPVRVVGSTAMKHQCLRAAGWRVLVVTKDSWDSLAGQQQAQQHLLRQLLEE